jgi:hypothetical protein
LVLSDLPPSPLLLKDGDGNKNNNFSVGQAIFFTAKENDRLFRQVNMEKRNRQQR